VDHADLATDLHVDFRVPAGHPYQPWSGRASLS
jgi:hypothetical protein